MSKVKNFFSSPLRSALFTLFATLLIVFAVFMIVRENNKIISLSDAIDISMQDMGYNYFDDYDKNVSMLSGDIDCFADGSKYYKLTLRASDGFDHTYFVWAKSGEIISSAKQESGSTE